MNTTFKMLGLSFFLLAAGGMQRCSPTTTPSGTYTVDTVRFVLTNQGSETTEPAPGIWIDTNTKLSGLNGGTVKSSKPYGIGFDYTDNTFSFTTLEFISVKLTYEDGAVEPRAKTLTTPLRIAARNYQSVNSVGGGRTVKTTARILSGNIPGIITRDEPFTLQIKGHFTRDDGSKIPFAIEQHYDIERENTTRAAADVLQDR